MRDSVEMRPTTNDRRRYVFSSYNYTVIRWELVIRHEIIAANVAALGRDHARTLPFSKKNCLTVHTTLAVYLSARIHVCCARTRVIYVCMCVCVHVCMCVYVCVRARACVYLCMFTTNSFTIKKSATCKIEKLSFSP